MGQPVSSAKLGRGDAALCPGAWRFCHCLIQLRGTGGWLARLSVAPQPPFRSPTPDTLQPVLHAGFTLLGEVGLVDSGTPLLWMGAPRARAELVSDLVLGLQHPHRPREPGDPGECPTVTPSHGAWGSGHPAQAQAESRGTHLSSRPGWE